jgi:hypothetical protein
MALALALAIFKPQSGSLVTDLPPLGTTLHHRRATRTQMLWQVKGYSGCLAVARITISHSIAHAAAAKKRKAAGRTFTVMLTSALCMPTTCKRADKIRSLGVAP